jgi:hypothetical protein
MRMVGNTGKLDEKEKGDERIYFTKNDGKIIFTLMFYVAKV